MKAAIIPPTGPTLITVTMDSDEARLLKYYAGILSRAAVSAHLAPRTSAPKYVTAEALYKATANLYCALDDVV